MEFPIDTEMPHWMRGIIWIAVVLGAVAYILKTVRNSGLLSAIAQELTPNSGGSVKDLVQQAADDSRVAVHLTKQLGYGYRKLVNEQAAIRREHVAIQEQIAAERDARAAEAKAIEKKLERLLKEEERVSKRADRPEASPS